MAVRLLHLKELPEAVEHLRRQCALPGTAVQEHGLAPTLAHVGDWAVDPSAAVRRCLVEALRPRGV